MADPLSIAGTVFGLATASLSASVKLYTTIRELQNHNKQVRALKTEIGDLTTILESLVETITKQPELNFSSLELPLQRCATACDDYGKLIARCSKHSTEGSRSSVRDWITQKYLQGDIDDFKDMLASYKSTIHIALVNANLRITVTTPQALEQYKELMSDTCAELNDHLKSIEAKIEQLSADASTSQHTGEANLEWQAMMEEKRSTQQGLQICAQLSAQIELLVPGSTAAPEENSGSSSPPPPSARRYVSTGINVAKRSIQDLVMQLRNHEGILDSRMQTMATSAPNPQDRLAELAQLRETKESLQQCIRVISDADETLASERQNIFEDITLSGQSLNFAISTTGDLVTARRINLTDHSRNVGGQISDDSFQKAVDAFAIDMNRNQEQSTSTDDSKFQGRGVTLSRLVGRREAASTST